ncbi:MAG TPA: DNA-3-methyladenine glycosylase [Bryobacteraceae bacterium]|jgi:DNA-3-methyladenine glycosylase II|nr:DNA-3-methyladenine glycosylase [Bryobacteraceae bacterium]
MKKAIIHLKKSDAVLAAIIDRAGAYKIRYAEPGFETLVRSIVSQQLNGRAADTIFGRLQEAAARAGAMTPESILKLRPAKMRSLGLSGQKMTYIRELARMTRDGEVNFEQCATLDDGAVVEHLTRVKGVGVWTVHMFLMFALRRHDVLPTGDFGIRMAMKKAYGLEDLPKPAEMEKIAAAWRPYSSVACWYLWRSLEQKEPEARSQEPE